MSTFESRWGFHPCDTDTFRKLKAIHKWYWQTLKDSAAWERWNRKLPKNRVIRKYTRDAAGNKVSSEIVGPQPEPRVCPTLEREAMLYHSVPWDSKWVQDYQRARMPKATKDEVIPLIHSVDEINQMYLRCRDHFAPAAAQVA